MAVAAAMPLSSIELRNNVDDFFVSKQLQSLYSAQTSLGAVNGKTGLK